MNKRSCENFTNDHKQKQRCIQRINIRKRSFDEMTDYKSIVNEYNQIVPEVLYQNIINQLKITKNYLEICKTPYIHNIRKNYEIESLLQELLNDIKIINNIQQQ